MEEEGRREGGRGGGHERRHGRTELTAPELKPRWSENEFSQEVSSVKRSVCVADLLMRCVYNLQQERRERKS